MKCSSLNVGASCVDPDGEFWQFALAYTIYKAGCYTIDQQGAGGNWNGGDFTKATGMAAVEGLLGGAAGLLAPSGAIPGALYGAATGVAIGGITSSLQGGNFASGAKFGAMGGAFFGGLGGLYRAEQAGLNIWTGEPINNYGKYLQVAGPLNENDMMDIFNDEHESSDSSLKLKVAKKRPWWHIKNFISFSQSQSFAGKGTSRDWDGNVRTIYPKAVGWHSTIDVNIGFQPQSNEGVFTASLGIMKFVSANFYWGTIVNANMSPKNFGVGFSFGQGPAFLINGSYADPVRRY